MQKKKSKKTVIWLIRKKVKYTSNNSDNSNNKKKQNTKQNWLYMFVYITHTYSHTCIHDSLQPPSVWRGVFFCVWLFHFGHSESFDFGICKKVKLLWPTFHSIKSHLNPNKIFAISKKKSNTGYIHIYVYTQYRCTICVCVMYKSYWRSSHFDVYAPCTENHWLRSVCGIIIVVGVSILRFVFRSTKKKHAGKFFKFQLSFPIK